MGNLHYVTKENFEAEVMHSAVPVLVDFWAPWCGPCRMLSPLLDQIADEYAGKAKICKVNIDEQEELAKRFKIMTIPTLIVFVSGKAADSAIGAVPKSKLAAMLDGAFKTGTK